MPFIDGYEFGIQLRELNNIYNKSIPLLSYSSNSLDQNEHLK